MPVQHWLHEADENAIPMRNPETKSKDHSDSVPAEAGGSWGTRGRADVTSFLLELARALRGFAFYSETHAQRRPLLDRAFRAVSGELSRAGAIELDLTKEGFRIEGLSRAIESNGVLSPLVTALQAHGLNRLRIDPTLTRTALHGFFDLLSQPGDRFESPECFARSLDARDSQGLRLNDIEFAASATTPKLSATPPRALASLGSMLISNEHTPSIAHGETSVEEPTLDDDPLNAPGADVRGERMRARLIELDQTLDDAAYQRHASDILVWAQDLWEDGQVDEWYRAVLVLADHAVGHGGRPEAQARKAGGCFEELASGDGLGDVIRRATGSGSAGIRAAQLLLQLGSSVVPALIDQICAEQDPDRSAPLHSLVLALGEASLPTLIAAIDGSDVERARIGLRLAGELQNPAIGPTLVNALLTRDLSLRIETMRALAFLPGQASTNALAEALDQNVERIVDHATRGIPISEDGDAIPPLIDMLAASLRTDRMNATRTLIDLLGHLGDERAVAQLSAILRRKPIQNPDHCHAIQIAAIDSLALLASQEARDSIEQVARDGAAPVRDHARGRLEAIGQTR